MIVYEALKRDHERLKQIFEQLDESSEEECNLRRELVQTLRDHLIPHARAEEKVLYQALKSVGGLEEVILKGYQEHSLSESYLRDLELIDPAESRWKPKLLELRKLVENHIKNEEQVVFALAEKWVSHRDSETAGEYYLLLKEAFRDGEFEDFDYIEPGIASRAFPRQPTPPVSHLIR